MTSSRSYELFTDSFLAWSRLAWTVGELTVASAQVIGHRAWRMASSGPSPDHRDRREFTLMGTEKGHAAAESAQAVGVRMLRLNQQLTILALEQMVSTSLALTSIAASRNAVESLTRQSKLARDTIASSAATASRLSGSAARLAQQALKPVHARVSSNAQRLGRRR